MVLFSCLPCPSLPELSDCCVMKPLISTRTNPFLPDGRMPLSLLTGLCMYPMEFAESITRPAISGEGSCQKEWSLKWCRTFSKERSRRSRSLKRSSSQKNWRQAGFFPLQDSFQSCVFGHAPEAELRGQDMSTLRSSRAKSCGIAPRG